MSADPAQVQLGFTKPLPLPVRSKPAGAGASPPVLRAATLAPVRARMMISEEAVQPAALAQGMDRMQPFLPLRHQAL